MRWGMGLVVLAVGATAWGAAPPVKGARGFTSEQQAWLDRTWREIGEHGAAGRFERAATLAGERVALRERLQGFGHHHTRFERKEWRRWQRLAKTPAGQRASAGLALQWRAEGILLHNEGKFGEAERAFRKALQLAEEALGGDHPEAARGNSDLARCLQARGKYAQALPLLRKALEITEKSQGASDPEAAAVQESIALCLNEQGKGKEALPLFRKAVAVFEKTLGTDVPETAAGYHNLATCLQGQGKASEALPLYRKALAILEKTLEDDSPRTAAVRDNLASCLQDQGKSSEALPLYRKALSSAEKGLGEGHPDTGICYNNVANCLLAQGKPAEALPVALKALQIVEKALGPHHPTTGTCANNVASALLNQEKPAEAIPYLRKAVAIREKALGPGHPETAVSYINLASCLRAMGKPAEALPLTRKALAIRVKALGEGHPDAANSYNHIAVCLQSQGKASEAIPLHRKALEIRVKALGEGHPDTAASHLNLAHCLLELGKAREALPLFFRALATCRASLGEDHPATANSYSSAASCLWEMGERTRAVRLLQQSLACQEAARFHTALTGFDRAQAQAGKFSPRAVLAVGLASLGQPRNAFAHAEAHLSRGLLDDLGSSAMEEAARLASLRERLAKLDATLVSTASLAAPTDEQRSRHEDVAREHRAILAELRQLAAADSARRVLPLERIQRAIPADAALAVWIGSDVRWACVLRAAGEPRWVRLPGTGEGGAWTKEDASLGERLYESLRAPASSRPARVRLSAAFVKQRFDPLRAHLKGVKRLFVVPSGEMARVPLESLVAGDFAVSYVPSGSMLALLREKHRPLGGSVLLAVGDPIFDRGPPPGPPSSGVLVRAVLPGSNAERAGLRPGDVLLSVGGVAIDSFDGVGAALKEAPAAIIYWREGDRLKGKLPGVPLGASLDERSARAAVRAWRKDQEAVAARGTGHKRLPGTRAEVEAIAALQKGVLLLGSEASEQRFDELRARGELKKFSLIHVATHGETDEANPGRSALILAQDRLPDPLVQVRMQRHVYDGRLTVARMRAEWELDADLVVLSACETGLGKEAGGDGLLGFAHAFLSKGARSVVLSRWKVDDTATALLMVRFYENLLARRKGLQKPMGKAAALEEARRWLRTLPRKEAGERAAAFAGGRLRGSVNTGKPEAPAKPPAGFPEGDRPYAHPYYWAAFTLVGDPD